jgi:hypothetical protein
VSASAPSAHDAVQHLADWIERSVPCSFAPAYVRGAAENAPSRVQFIVAENDFSDEAARRASVLFEIAGRQKKFACILWPRVRTATDLLDQLSILVRDPRWRCRRLPWGEKHARPKDCLLQLEWSTAAGAQASVMGFMPHGSMPLARRAPYAAVVLWPGIRENGFLEHPQQESIGFIDADPGVATDEAFKKARNHSTELTRTLQRYTPEDLRLFRKVAFSLPNADVNPFADRLEGRPTVLGRARRWWHRRTR